MFKDIISRIKPLHTESMDKCQLRLDNLTKPLNSLLYFEQIARQMAGITHNPRPRTVKKSIIVLTDAGAKPSIATNVFAGHVGAQIVTADITTIEKSQTVQQEILSAIEWGINIAGEEIAKGTQVIGLGQIYSGSAEDSKEILACFQDEQGRADKILQGNRLTAKGASGAARERSGIQRADREGACRAAACSRGAAGAERHKAA